MASAMMPRAPTETFARLDALSRTRALTDAESRELEWAIKEIDRKDERVPFWTRDRDSRLMAALYNGKTLRETVDMLGCTKGMVAGRYSRLRGMREARGRAVA
nr:hypothetical protein [Sphingomonas sp. SCN 67-18]